MKNYLLATLLLIGIVSGCAPSPATEITIPTVETATTDPYPAVVGPEPSYKVAAFYYPWYGDPQTGNRWIHWDQNDHQPPQSIGSDYYPALGAYSSKDPVVVAQHMAWLRQAGIGVIISSWWGSGSYEDRAVPLLLEMAERYGIKVAFHIEPYSNRSDRSLVNDIKYLYAQYGESPAFFRSTASTRYSPGDQEKGMFFVWSIGYDQENRTPLTPDYWLSAMDTIHALPEGALIIAESRQGNWIDDAHVDGLYNYITIHLEADGGFDWARSMPSNSLYIPSVMPGNSARRVGYPESTYAARLDGETYNDQWETALGTGVQPELVTITSFNEWHEGSMIEPIAIDMDDGLGYTYQDFGALPPDGYLTLTRDWVDEFLSRDWPDQDALRVRIQIKTNSDWTTFALMSGGWWIRPERISTSEEAVTAGWENGSFLLMQSLDNAMAGNEIEMTWDLGIAGLMDAQDVQFRIERGNIGATEVSFYRYEDGEPILVDTFEWARITQGRNPFYFGIPSAIFLSP